MRIILAAFFIAILGACSTINSWLSSDTAQKGIEVACSFASAADSAFQVVAPSLSQADRDYESKSYEIVRGICANPPKDATAAVVQIMSMARQVYGLLNDKNVQAAVSAQAKAQ